MNRFCGKDIMSEEEIIRCNAFHDEVSLDMRINSFRETQNFKSWAPKEKTHTICLWLKDAMGGYYSPGKMVLDNF